MFCTDYLSLKSSADLLSGTESRLAAILERLFLAWIGGVAALAFFIGLALALSRMITVVQLFYVYGSITVITLGLAFLLFVARRNA